MNADMATRYIAVTSCDLMVFQVTDETSVADESCGDADEREEVLRLAFVATM
ncbi:hypothetical protein ACWIG5_20750 [Streptomyces lydicus]